MTQERLDLISRPNLARVARDWEPVVPNDNAPVMSGLQGNVGAGCFGLFVSREGYVRFISRGQQRSLVAGAHHDVDWLDATTAVELGIGGVMHPVQWLPAIPGSVRVYAQAGDYLYGEVVHVMAHDTTATEIFALLI